jgi:glycine/D-amino acid oxidase-like deaminating enzyme
VTVYFDPPKATHDFIIVGAGIAGVSTAYELSHSARVCVVEGEERPGMHATSHAAALFAPSYGGRQIRALTRARRAFCNRPTAGLNRRCCAIVVAVHRAPVNAERLDQMASEIRTWRASGFLETRGTAACAAAAASGIWQPRPSMPMAWILR